MALSAARALDRRDQEPVRKPAAEMRQGDRGGERAARPIGRNEGGAPPVLGGEMHAGGDRVGRRCAGARAAPSSRISPSTGASAPNKVSEQPALAGAERPGDRRRPRRPAAQGRSAARPRAGGARAPPGSARRWPRGRRGGRSRPAGRSSPGASAEKSIGGRKPATTRPPRSTTTRLASRCRSCVRWEM